MQLSMDTFINELLSGYKIKDYYLPAGIVEMDNIHFGNDFPSRRTLVINYASKLPSDPPIFVETDPNIFILIEDKQLPDTWKSLSYVYMVRLEASVSISMLLSDLTSVFFSVEPNNTTTQTKSKRMDFLINQILSGKLTDQKEIDMELKKNSIACPSGMILFVISGNQNETMTMSPANYYHLFEGIWPFSHLFVRESLLVLLVGSNNNVQNLQYLERMDRILEENDMWAGRSEVFSSLNCYFRNYFYRAAVTCRIIPVLEQYDYRGRCKTYRQIALFYSVHHFVNNSTNGIDPIVLVPPKLLELLEYDKKKHTEYVPTLAAYWKNNRSTQNICESLHIHKNTLFYRLQKTQEFLGNDFNDIAYQLDCHLGIAILEVLGYFHNE